MKNLFLLLTLLLIANPNKGLSAFRTLEADYITNVFSQSNFVKNPNARVNTQNVTGSTGVVFSRSTTTPLYETSEFVVTAMPINSTLTWATRSLDAGMKNQNCEARFTYRGFTVGVTKAQILQGASVVAQLSLTGSATDPKVASINFPCGDLSTATSFVIKQETAALTGTNEVGGVYVGLATNMANVAQAEFVGQSGYGTGLDLSFATSSTTYADLIASQTIASGVENQGSASSALPVANQTPLQTTISNPKAGNYFVNFSGVLRHDSLTQAGNCAFRIAAIVDGSPADPGVGADQAVIYQSNAAQTELSIGGNASLSFELTKAPTSLSFKLMGRLTSGGGACRARIDPTGTGATRMKFTVHRFPLSSELVVTPERQNTYAGLKGYSTGAPTNAVATAAWTKLTATATLTRSIFGKAKLESNNDYSITIENLPVGNYYVSTTGIFYSTSSQSGIATSCYFGIADTGTGGAQIASMQVNSVGDATAAAQQMFSSTIGGVYRNNSVANKTFYVQAFRASGAGTCNSYTDTERPFTITVIPLDQPTNSALYVQAPVKASETGEAISSGYVGEGITTKSSAYSSSSVFSSGDELILKRGVYLVRALVYVGANGTKPTAMKCSLASVTNSNLDSTGFLTDSRVSDYGNTTQPLFCNTSGYYRVTEEEGYFYPVAEVISPTTGTYNFIFHINAVRLN